MQTQRITSIEASGLGLDLEEIPLADPALPADGDTREAAPSTVVCSIISVVTVTVAAGCRVSVESWISFRPGPDDEPEEPEAPEEDEPTEDQPADGDTQTSWRF